MALTLATGCKKDSEDKPVTAKGTLLTELKNNTDFIRFNYNADSSVKSAVTNALIDSGVTTTYNVIYGADKKIERLESANGKKLVAEYEAGILQRVDHFIDDERVGSASYAYENGLLRHISYYSVVSPTEMEPVFGLHYEYTTEKLLKESILMGLSETPNLLRRKGHIAYEYDSNINPLYKNKDLFLFFFQPVSQYNVTYEGHYDADLQLEDKMRYTYQYNNKQLPVSADVKIGMHEPYENGKIIYTY